MNSKHKKKQQLIRVEFTYLEAALLMNAIGDVWPSKLNGIYPHGHEISISPLWNICEGFLGEVVGETYATIAKHPHDLYIEKVKEDEASNKPS